MDEKFERLAANGQYPVCILGNQATLDFELVALTAIDEVLTRKDDLLGRGFCFVGVLGIVDGRAQAALDGEISAPAQDLLTHAYIAHVLSSLPRLTSSTH